ncbi:pyridoxal-phosphate dependent enzyme [Spirillospora sp. NBC_01491]|uniref:pyridoxal-phosphate dependent enzyme n=1 Tax=Spirillospora sp. NBC_01491 TaxID=2976007 RepID=UPI002E3084DE|nr:pyridoxal-phosphate dependent enzyme [Spirillospora sp. NBC_01491]
MRFHDSMLDLVGQTPLVRLAAVADRSGPLVLAKLEQFNPGGSAKDRIAVGMVTAAERDGSLRPGGTIVEPTSGNTGIGLALVGAQRGYRCVFTCPDKVSPSKIAALRAYGAEVVVCPAAVPMTHPRFYRNVATRMAAEIPGAHCIDQYNNPANPAAHYAVTGPEIWEQTQGRLTHFVAGLGTGGTVSGVGRYLHEVSAGAVQVIGVDPQGSAYSGEEVRPYYVEGVGQPGIPAAFDPAVPDGILTVGDAESIRVTRRLAREEGILTGGSGGMAVAAALRVAERAGPDAVIVVLIPDSGRGYLTTIFDDDWLAGHGFTEPADGVPVAVAARHGLPVLAPQERLATALRRMRDTRTGHMAVSAATPPIRLPEIVGFAAEHDIAVRVATGQARLDAPVAEHLTAPLPTVGWGQRLGTAAARIAEHGACVVLRDGLPVAIVTATDMAAALESEHETTESSL